LHHPPREGKKEIGLPKTREVAAQEGKFCPECLCLEKRGAWSCAGPRKLYPPRAGGGKREGKKRELGRKREKKEYPKLAQNEGLRSPGKKKKKSPAALRAATKKGL